MSNLASTLFASCGAACSTLLPLSLPSLLTTHHANMTIPSTFQFHTTSTEAATHYKNEIAGKTVLITGVSPNGLGAEAATAIAQSEPKLLILAGRSIDKINETRRAIEKVAPRVELKVLILDLGSFKAAKKAGQELLSWDLPIDV